MPPFWSYYPYWNISAEVSLHFASCAESTGSLEVLKPKLAALFDLTAGSCSIIAR
jgi:hypothetical protein